MTSTLDATSDAGSNAASDAGSAISREEMVQRVRALGPQFAERAVRYDRDATFPWENFADLREAGLLALCVPAAAGGLGASFADYARVSAEIGRYCGATALTFNMHNATMLWAGEVSDLLDFTAEDRALHHARRAELFRGVVQDGTIHSQPFSEGISAGATFLRTKRVLAKRCSNPCRSSASASWRAGRELQTRMRSSARS